MSWTGAGGSNVGLIRNLEVAGFIKSKHVANAMLLVDRANYAPADPYNDSPQIIGFRATISAPHMHAAALEELFPNIMKDDARVLDVGCGSGYLTAAIARLNNKAKVFGMDYIPELTRMSLENIRKSDGDLLDSGRVEIHTGDGWKGYRQGAPYDVIHVGAAAATIPNELLYQLKVGGSMLIPVGPEGSAQALVKINRVKEGGPLNEAYTINQLFGVQYVPLVHLND